MPWICNYAEHFESEMRWKSNFLLNEKCCFRSLISQLLASLVSLGFTSLCMFKEKDSNGKNLGQLYIKAFTKYFHVEGGLRVVVVAILHIKEYIGHVLVYITLKETFLLFFPLFLGGWKWSFRENSYGEIRVFMKKNSSHDEIDFLLTNTRTMMWKMRNFIYIYVQESWY